MKKSARSRLAFLAVFAAFAVVAGISLSSPSLAGLPSNNYCGAPGGCGIWANTLWKQVGSQQYYLGSAFCGDQYSCIGIWDSVNNYWISSKESKYGDLRQFWSTNLGGTLYPIGYPPCSAGSGGSGNGCASGCPYGYLDQGYCVPSGTEITYAQGDSVTIGWTFPQQITSGGGFTAYAVTGDGGSSASFESANIIVNGPGGIIYLTTAGQSSGSASFTLYSSATPGEYNVQSSATYSDGEVVSSDAAESVSGLTKFEVITGVNVQNTPTCSSFGYSDWGTCSYGSQTRSVTSSSPSGCTGGNPVTSQSCLGGVGATCSADNQCSSGPCVNDQCSISSTPQDKPAKGTIDPTNGAAISGWACDPDWQAAGQAIDVQLYLDGPAGSGTSLGSVTANQPSEQGVANACGSNNNNQRFNTQLPSQYWDGKTHQVYAYAVGKDSSGTNTGNNPELSGAPQSIMVSPAAVQCSSFGYSDWGTCSYGSQTRSVTSSSPSGCTGGNPVTSQSCSGSLNNLCNADGQCGSGLVCTNGQCKDTTPQTHKACSNYACTSVSGSGADSCGVDADCRSQLGGSCSTSSNCQPGLVCQNNLCTTPPTISSAYWQDMHGTTITGADKNDRVAMRIDGSHLSGQQITFTWYKSVPLWFDTQLGTDTVTASSDNYVSDSQLMSTDGNIYFTATGVPTPKTSSNLAVNTNISDSPPVAVISNPTANGIYLSSNAISFSQASYDVDSNIASYSWNFGDGGTSSQASDSHTYTSAGQKTITLTVTDEQGARASTQVSILVVGSGQNIYPFIEQPSDQQAVINNNLIVSYSARQSYAVNVTTSGSTITGISCIAGNCPGQTSNSPPMTITPTSGSGSFNNLFFNWTYGDAGLGSTSGMGAASGSKGFASTGSKNITLNLQYNGLSLKQSYSRSFMLFNQRQCSSDGTTWYKIDSNGNVAGTYNTMNTIACAGADLQAGTADDCCPQGFSCSTSGSSPGCVADGDGTLGCSTYSDQASCNTDAANRAQNEVLWSYFACGTNQNGTNVLCSCAWNTQRNACEFSTNSRLSNDPQGSVSSCSYSTNSSVCANGYQTVTITASGDSNDPACVNSVQTLPCGRPVIELPFVTTSNIVAALVIIGAIYFVIIRSGKSAKRKTK